MNTFSEDNLIEQSATKLLGELWGADNVINAFAESGEAELYRDDPGQVVLIMYLKIALVKLNPDASTEALNLAIDEVIRDRSMMSSVMANKQVWDLIRDGVRVEVKQDDGTFATEVVTLVDFAHPENNHFLCVSQMWVTGQLHKRRPDVIGFVNGMPLVLIELKAAHRDLRNAYHENIRDYKDTIPQLFWYNACVILSNGIESKVGTISSSYEHFDEWKKVESENEEGKVSLETILRGVCAPLRLLDLVENFTLFDESKATPIKIIARYFQYFGVNRAFDQVLRRDENNGRLGVFWHTQGSGKSYSMIFLSQKVFRKVPGNFTFVLITDRNDLDKQIYRNFSGCGAVRESEEFVHAGSREHLKELLRGDHHHVFTLIQKFDDDGVLSDRSDIIVMADEAHRTQYDRMAMNMRKALPNASFIGFTGTPLLATGEEETRNTFGDYVSTYNFRESVKDKATVPLFYENRIPHLENRNPDIERDLAKVMEYYDLSPEEEERVEQSFSTFYELITREDRLNVVVQDIVQHFINRGYQGKAMVVSIDKKTAIRMYTKFGIELTRYQGKLAMDLDREENEHEKEKIKELIDRCRDAGSAVVVSQSQNEIADMREFGIDMLPIRKRMLDEDLETEFKKEDSNLRIVFVCAMWLTGFDVPNLSTLYLDKPLKNHTLMQTIARANRVYPDKVSGLIVDYIGVFRNIQNALALYAAGSGTSDIDDIIEDKTVLVENFAGMMTAVRTLLATQGLAIADLLGAQDFEKIRLVDVFTNTLIAQNEIKKKFQSETAAMVALFKSILPDPRAEEFYHELTAYKAIASRIFEIEHARVNVDQVKKDLEDLLDRSIKTGEYNIKSSTKLVDLSGLDLTQLQEFFAKAANKNILAEELKTELQQKIEDMLKKNKSRAHFLERLNKLIAEYNSGARNLDDFYTELVDIVGALSEEQARAVAEGLNEEELAIFDLLKKEPLNPDEVRKVKSVAHDLLVKLKSELLTLEWRAKFDTRAAVKIVITDLLVDELPSPYTDIECQERAEKVYFHIFDSYLDVEHNVYA
jgi:type I restriction enzyme R subunit